MRHLRKKSLHLLRDLVTLAFGFLIIFPILYGVAGAFKSPAEFSAFPPTVLPRSFGYTANFETVLRTVPMMRYFLNSFIVASLVSTIRLLLAVLAAYAFVYFTFPGRGLLFVLLLATMMLPGDTLLVTNYQTVARMGLLNTYTGMCVTSLVGASQMFMLRQSFRSTPVAFREAGMLDGCGDLRFLFSVLLPISRPVLVTLFVQSFIAAWNTYLWPLMVTSHDAMRTVQVGITMLTSIEGTNYETVLAGVTLSLIPALFVFIFLRRGITKAMTAGSLVG